MRPLQELETANTVGEQETPESEILELIKSDLAELYLKHKDYGTPEKILGQTCAIFHHL